MSVKPPVADRIHGLRRWKSSLRIVRVHIRCRLLVIRFEVEAVRRWILTSALNSGFNATVIA